MSSQCTDTPDTLPFLKLPTKVRIMIYGLLVVSDRPIHLGGLPKRTTLGLRNHPWKHPYECIHLNILRVNRQIHEEASIKLYARNIVVIGYGWGIRGLGVFSVHGCGDTIDQEDGSPAAIYAHNLGRFAHIRLKFLWPKFYFQTMFSNSLDNFRRVLANIEKARILSPLRKVSTLRPRKFELLIISNDKSRERYSTCIDSIMYEEIALTVDLEIMSKTQCCWLKILALSSFNKSTTVDFICLSGLKLSTYFKISQTNALRYIIIIHTLI